MRDVLRAILVVIVIVVGMLAVSIGIAYPISKYNCNQYAEQLEINTEFHMWGAGCLLEIDGQKIPKSKWINNTGN